MTDKQVCLRKDIADCPYRQAQVNYAHGMSNMTSEEISKYSISYCYSMPCMKATEDKLEGIWKEIACQTTRT